LSIDEPSLKHLSAIGPEMNPLIGIGIIKA